MKIARKYLTQSYGKRILKKAKNCVTMKMGKFYNV